MKNFTQLKEPRAVRPARVAASAAAVAAAFAAAVAGPANAAKQPELKYGVLTVEGTKANDKIALRLKAGDPAILQVDVGDDGSADFSFARKNIAEIEVDAGAGDDFVRIDESNGAFADTIPTTIDGGSGNDNLTGGSGAETLRGGAGDDTVTGGSGASTLRGGAGDDTLIGGSGAETLRGGAGNDSVAGNRGNDLAFLGSGDDTFVWNPGDGSDTVEGRAGTDTMQFNGSNVNEKIDLSANGGRLRLFRDVGNITMDTNGVEQVNVVALGGADTITANDLTGTDVDKLNVDLAAPPGSGVGDALADQVIVTGTNGPDTITATGSNGAATVTGLAATVNVTGAEPANDTLAINALGGDDTVDASGLAAAAIKFTTDGGAGADTITGGQGDDVLLGGDGNDSINGGRGNDVAFLGSGDDTFVWNPGDGSDVVEGQSGTDTMQFNGSNVGEKIDLSANGSRLRLFRDVGNITMDTNGVEHVNVVALGGADTITANDLTGTDVSTFNVDLAGTPGSGVGDAQADQVIVNGTNSADAITAAGSNGAATVTGLTATVNVTGAEPANDRLTIDALGGDDAVEASGLASTAIALTINGGDGADVLIGGAGDDTLFGGAGDDVLIGGPGQDLLDGGPGNNVLIQ
jgi:Ca2+-binding RTX toxin-like protein